MMGSCCPPLSLSVGTSVHKARSGLFVLGSQWQTENCGEMCWWQRLSASREGVHRPCSAQGAGFPVVKIVALGRKSGTGLE